MASEKDEKLYKVRALPVSVERELRRAAKAQEIALRRAFRFVMAAEPDVVTAIRAGQKADVKKEKRSVLQMHLPAKEKSAIDRYAEAADVDQCEVGKFVLIHRRGSLSSRIVLGMAAPISGVEARVTDQATTV